MKLLQAQVALFELAVFCRSRRLLLSGVGAAGVVLSATIDAAGRIGRSETYAAHGESRAGGDDSLRPDAHLRLVRLADVARARVVQHDLRSCITSPGRSSRCLAALILFAIVLQTGGMATRTITVEHYHDLGKAPAGFHRFLGLHGVFAVHVDLVREYPRGKRLVSCPADGPVDVDHRWACCLGIC